MVVHLFFFVTLYTAVSFVSLSSKVFIYLAVLVTNGVLGRTTSAFAVSVISRVLTEAPWWVSVAGCVSITLGFFLMFSV